MSAIVEAIETTILRLPPSELAEFRRWFLEFDASRWDTQIEADGAAGNLDTLADEAWPNIAAARAVFG